MDSLLLASRSFSYDVAMLRDTKNRGLERIGVLGGSFNPIHLGHLAIAETALAVWNLDHVLFMPCCMQPHKAPDALAPAAHRRAMVEVALADHPHFQICDIELERGGPSYAIDSVRELQDCYPQSLLHFIIGGDTLTELHKWHRIDELLAMCKILALARPGAGMDSMSPADLKLPEAQAVDLLADVELSTHVDISASQVRASVAAGRSIRYLVPRPVAAYIERHGLYR